MSTVYETVTQNIISELEKGVAPWVKPWKGGNPNLPYNAVSQRHYSGINVLLLWNTAFLKGYRHTSWLTWNQAKELGGHVRKGEHAEHIVYASTYAKKEHHEDTGEDEARKIPFLKFYTVFNVEQVDELPPQCYVLSEPPPLTDALQAADAFILAIKADTQQGGDKAAYYPTLDRIIVPKREQFSAPEHYFATSLHEHVHWSGHGSRLARDLSGKFGDEAYAKEELVAELGSAFLCAHLGVPGELRHPEYIGSWLSVLKGDKRAIFSAASKATQAAQYLRVRAGEHIEAEVEHE
jgi:antirestriction protein ArdC